MRRAIPPEYPRYAVQMRRGGMKGSEIAALLGVTPTIVYRWCREAEEAERRFFALMDMKKTVYREHIKRAAES